MVNAAQSTRACLADAVQAGFYDAGARRQQRWGTAAAAAALVAAIAAGRLDAVGGRLVGAWEQLDGQEPHGDTRTLRVQAP